ncbi:hypothetical protein B5X24_HaOG203802 [Helicoverpa armigera]|nr:hypothetical protein B5X24_HaOG203802 [Helicoverpa armigera]
MVGYFKLETRREVALASYLFKVLRGKICNPDILGEIRFCVPDEYVGRRRRPPMLEVPRARTNLLQRAPLTRAVRTLNAIANRLDLFTCSLNDFTVVAYRVLSFRARALDASKPMPIYLAEELPDLPDYSAINRAVPQMPSGMEKEEESGFDANEF